MVSWWWCGGQQRWVRTRVGPSDRISVFRGHYEKVLHLSDATFRAILSFLSQSLSVPIQGCACNDTYRMTGLQPGNSPEWTVGDWFRCPGCAATSDDRFRVKFIFGFKNSSLSLECRECGYRHKERDPRSPNWRRGLRWRLLFTAQYHTHPQCSRELHVAAICPGCSGRSVRVELESVVVEEGEWSSRYKARFAADCENCGESYETFLSH